MDERKNKKKNETLLNCYLDSFGLLRNGKILQKNYSSDKNEIRNALSGDEECYINFTFRCSIRYGSFLKCGSYSSVFLSKFFSILCEKDLSIHLSIICFFSTKLCQEMGNLYFLWIGTKCVCGCVRSCFQKKKNEDIFLAQFIVLNKCVVDWKLVNKRKSSSSLPFSSFYFMNWLIFNWNVKHTKTIFFQNSRK